jgi:CRP/FNR family transcriptional regulator, nitrogen fixation regulation protein
MCSTETAIERSIKLKDFITRAIHAADSATGDTDMLMPTEIQSQILGHRATPQRGVPSTCDDTLLGAIEIVGFINPYSENNEIFGEKEPARYLYKVVSGSVRTYRILESGRRQIAAVYVAGEVFGFEVRDEHTLSAEAISECALLLMRRSTLAETAERDNMVARQLWALTVAELGRMRDHVLLLGKAAHERVAGFLVEMAQRLSVDDMLELTMSRQDIADYLGLTVETVSRSFTHLESIGAIEMQSSRRIVLRNHAGLVRLSAGS